MYRSLKKNLKKAAAATFAAFIALVFVGGSADYILSNGEALLKAACETPVPVPEPHITTPPTAAPQKLEKEKAMEVLVEWKDKPVDFLEEVLPQSSADPSRGSAPVEEIIASGGDRVQNFFVSDTSSSGLNLEEELGKALGFSCDTISEPTVLLYHTHTCESYLPVFSGFTYTDASYRSPDPNKNMVVVGERIKVALEEKGIGVIHDTTIHDAPAFNGAYQRSMETVQSYLEKYPSIKVTIDVHRDSMTSDEGVSYKPTAMVDGRKSAQVMIIAGSDPTGELAFENWRDNLVFALKLQKKAANLYPNLMRPLMYCPRKYNMDATNASLIFEVGTEVNTFSEAKYAGTLMGNTLAAVLKDGQGES